MSALLAVLGLWLAASLTAGAVLAVIGYRLKASRPPRRRCDRP